MKKGLIIGGIIGAVCIAGIGFGAMKANSEGVVINDVRVRLSELDDYKNIVEAGMEVPDVITDGTDEMEGCLSWSLGKEYEFSVRDLFGSVDLPIKCEVNEGKLKTLLNKMNSGLPEMKNAYVDTEAKAVVPEQFGERIDIDKAIEDICKATESGDTVTLSDYVIEPTIFADDLQTSVDEYWKYKNWTVTYEGTDIKIEVPDTALKLTEDGEFEIIDHDFLDDYVAKVASTFGTVGKNHSFTNHDGEEITVHGGTFGNIVNKGTEKETLSWMFDKADSQEGRRPIYSTYIDDGFDTYVEVSLDEQHVWLYEDGELVMDSDCVSGTKGTTRETPSGFWYMDVVMPGKMLYPSGESKGTWVDRWMRFSPDGCGLHDAGWRSRFGGNIYKTSGSHGCVNLPPKFAFNLYEHAYTGMPVIVY